MVSRVLREILVRVEIRDRLEILEHLGPRDSPVHVDHRVILDHSEPLVILDRLGHWDRLAVMACLD